MTSREAILAAVKKNKPASTPYPDMKNFVDSELNVLDKFVEVLRRIGGKELILQAHEDMNTAIRNAYPEAALVTTTVPEINFANLDLASVADAHDLEKVDLAILQGQFAVAENGAIWMSGSSLVHHAIPFITQHLVIVISKDAIVQNMHLAYQRLSLETPGYGVFIAGPSKTADIEQSLVIGAHGSRSLLVVLR